ncbi:MAG TPA: LysM peptidoglycan-binding domain-containing protein, partial [Opitutaceae bacterium]|nr:LysM peptidoglycan-binding domain-containing protein [Opitutaceae bacterium]
QLSTALAEVARLRTENAALAASVRALQGDKAGLERRLAGGASTTDRASQLEKENAALREQVQSTNRRVTELQSAVAAARTAAKPAGEDPAAVAELRGRIDRLQQDNEALLARVKDANDTATRLSADNARLVKGSSESGGDAARVAMLAADNARLNDEIKRSTAELGNLYRQLRSAQSKLSKAEESAKPAPAPGATDAALAALQAENAKLKQDLADGTNTLQDLRGQLAAADQARSALNERSQKLEQQVAALRSRPAADPAEADRRARAEEALARAQQDLVASRRETEELRARADGAEANLRVQAARFQDQLKEARMTAASAATQTAEQALKTKLADAQAQIAALTKANADLQAKAATLAAAPAATKGDSAEAAKLKSDLASATKAATAATAEAERLAAQVKQLTQQQAELARANQDLVTRNDELTAQTQKLQAQRQAAGRSSAEIDQLKAALAAAERAQAAAKDDLAKLTAQFNEAQKWGASVTAANEELAGKNDALTTQVKKLQGELDAAGKAGTDTGLLKTALGAAQQAASAAQTDVTNLTRANRELGTKIDELTAEAQRLRAQQAVAGRATAEVEQLKTALAAAQQAQATARDNVTRLTQQNQDLATKVDQLTAQAQTLQAQQAGAGRSATELAQLKTALAAAQDQLGRTQAELEATKQTALTAAAARSDLESRLAAAQSDAAGLKVANQKLTTENQRLAARPDGTADRETATKLAAQLDAANRALEERNASIAGLAATNDSLQKDLEVAKQSTAAALAAQAAAAKNTAGDALKLELQTVQDQVRTLEAQLDDERKHSAQEISTLAGQLQRSREANKSLAEANRVLLEAKSADEAVPSAELNSLNAKVRNLTGELERLRGETQRLTTENDRLADEKQTAERLAAEAKKAATAPAAAWAQEREGLGRQLDDLMAKVADADRRLALGKQSETDNRKALQNLQAELDKAHAETAALQARLTESDKAVEQHNGSVAELTDLNAKLTAERTTLQAQLAQARQALEAAGRDSSAKADTVAQLTSANDQLQAQVKDLADKVAAAQADKTQAAQNATEVANLRTQLAAAQAKLTESDKAVDQQGATVAELTEANQHLTSEREALRKQLDDQATQLAALKADSDKLAQSEQARITAEQRAAALATITSQLTAAQRDNASLRADNARLTETLQSVDRDRSARIAQLQQENAAISARLRQAQGTLDSIANAARVLNGGALPQVASSGQVPIRPASASPVSAAPENRYHVVQEGDSLTRISVRYYGTAQRWNEIYDANRDLLRGENALRPGQRLKIP